MLGLFLVSMVSAQSETRVDFIVGEDDGSVESYVSSFGFWDLYWSYVLVLAVALVAVVAIVKLKKKTTKRSKKISKKKKR